MNIDELIRDCVDNTTDLGGEQLVNIDVDDISTQAKCDAHEMVENLSKFFYDKDFISDHPQIKRRIDDELESMRILLKMRKADEEAHDALLKAISSNNNNASLYKALTQIQGTILSVTTKIGEIVDRLNNMMKGYQLEIPYEHPEQQEAVQKKTYRGSKEFIKQMILEEQQDTTPDPESEE